MAKLKLEVKRRIEEMVGQGLDDERIARQLGLTPRTIASNRRRLLAESPDSPVNLALRDALVVHWGKLADAANTAERRLAMPTPDTLTVGAWKPTLLRGDRDDVRIRALRDHLSGDPRGLAFAYWEEHAQRLEDLIGEATAWVTAQEDRLNRRGAATMIEWACTGQDPDQHLQQGDRELRADATMILGEADDVPDLDNQFRRLHREIPTTDTGAALLEAWRDASERNDDLRETLWELTFMDGFPGHCRLCPIRLPLQGQRRTGRR